MNSQRTLIGEDVHRCWRDFAPLLIELSAHNLPMLDWEWRHKPNWVEFRAQVMPRLLGTPYDEIHTATKRAVSRPSPRLKAPPLDAELVEDATRCFNLMRAKIWHGLQFATADDQGATVERQIIRWLEHLTLECSARPDFLDLEFALELPEAGQILYHKGQHGLVYASAPNNPFTDAAARDRLARLVADKFRALRDWIASRGRGYDEFASDLEALRHDLLEARRARLRGAAFPEFVTVRFTEYDGHCQAVRPPKPMRVRVKSRASRAPAIVRETSVTILEQLHRRRFELAARRRAALVTGAWRTCLAQSEDGFTSVASMAKRWRWLTQSSNGIATMDSFTQSLPDRLLDRDMPEYVNLQVDICMYESAWDDDGEFDPMGGAAIDVDLITAAQRRDGIWWVWYVATSAPYWSRLRAQVDPHTADIASAAHRCRAAGGTAADTFGRTIERELRAIGHSPERVIKALRPDAPYFEASRLFASSEEFSERS